MRRTLLAVSVTASLVLAACTGGDGATTAPGSEPAGSPGTSPAGSPAESAGGGLDPASISGSATLGQWESSPSEREALSGALEAFSAAYPNVTVEQETVAGDYRAQMITRFGAGNPPDVFYVNAEYAKDWIDEGFLLPLDDYIARQGLDTSAYFEDYLNIFKGDDGKIYGLPKDGNTIVMAYNTDLVESPPASMDELLIVAESLKGQGSLKAPLCLNPGLDRGLAFLYAQGGSLLSEDNSASAITAPESASAVQWYLDLFRNGLGMTAADMGDGWCGEALGKGDAAIAFEGGWLVGFMNDSFPDTPYALAEMPVGSSGDKVTISYTAAYGIGVDSANPDPGWAVAQFLAGPEGMGAWTGGGIAVPSRSDVPVPEGFDAIVAGAEYSRPGSGFIRGYNDVQKAFQDAFTLEIQNQSFSADPVVAATDAAIQSALSR